MKTPPWRGPPPPMITFDVTVLRRDRVLHDHALIYSKDGSHSLLGHPIEGWIDDEYEGIAWIRGHHALDSKEVAAMRVAQALVSQ